MILRYYRERQPAGKYNVIHVYYLRDEKGDHWEGTSGIQPQDGELGIKYTGQRVDKAYDFQPENEDRPYTYTWDGRPQYGEVDESDHMGDFDPDTNEFAGDGKVYRPNNSWTAAEGTKEGNQIIILRYYRELSKEGQYNIVHEYYSREDSESQDSAEDSGSGGGTEENPERERTVLRSRSIRAENGEEEEISDTFTGTLNRDDGFVYTFEGRTGMESVTAPLGSTHTAGEDDWKLAYEGNTYTYIDSGYGAVSDDTNYSSNPNQQWASATEEGNEVIILRYYRESDEPDSPISGVSYKVVHEYYVRDREGSQTLVGISAIDEVTDAAPNEHYTQEHIRKEPVFQGDTYTYFDWGCGTASGQSYSQISGKEYVEATESGDQIIILRYYRQPDDPLPTDSPKYDEREEETEDSDITSEKSTKALKASGSPAKPSAAGGADSPDVSNAQDGKRPKTGDDSRIALWVILAAVSLGGLAIVRLIQRKRNGK